MVGVDRRTASALKVPFSATPTTPGSAAIARKARGLNSSFTVRKISYGEGVERVFPLYSPRVASIELVRRGDVRRAKLYYLRGRTGKSARIAEKLGHKADKAGAEKAAAAKE